MASVRRMLVVLLTLLLWGGALPPANATATITPATIDTTLATLPALDARRSLPLRTPIPFSMIGMKAPEGAHLKVRTSRNGSEWSAWSELEALDEGPDAIEGVPQPSAAQVPTAPMWTGAAQWLQVEVDGASPAQVAVTLIDTLGQSRSLATRVWDAARAAWRGDIAYATVAQPAIISRAGWGADESLRDGDPSYARRVKIAVVHHTVNANSYSAAEAPALIRGIYRYHTRSLGWSDIGYNALVDRFGRIYEGRYGGLERGVIGAHAGGFNTGTFGVASLGTHSSAGPNPDALEALAKVIAWKFDVHHIDVTGSAVLRSRGSTRYAEDVDVRVPTITGHRALSQTSCPGQALDSLLPAIRHRVLELGGDAILDPLAQPDEVTMAFGRAVEGAVQFSARLRPAGPWTLVLRDPHGGVVQRSEGVGSSVSATWAPVPRSELGRYTWTLSSPGRRDAVEIIDLVLPTIRDAAASEQVARGGKDGGFAQPVTFTARLWPQAAWRVDIFDPTGTPVHSVIGAGERLSAAWSGRAGLAPGRYSWRISGDDAPPVNGNVEVLWPVLSRMAAGEAAVGAGLAVSREVFRPLGAKHAVVARAELFADALAAGPLAGRDGPVLMTPSGSLDARVRAELERILPPGSTVYLLGGAGALSPAVENALKDRWTVRRLAGPGRVETAVVVADEVLRLRPSAEVMIARAGPDSANPWADAVAGGAYGAYAGVPVLLTDHDQLSPLVAALIARYNITRATVLGGPSAIAESVLKNLPQPRRIYGADRAGTAVSVAERLWGRRVNSGADVLIATDGYAADSWALALAAAPLAARSNAPLLLLSRDQLPPATRTHLEGLNYSAARPAMGWLMGGTDRVGQAVADETMRLMQ